MGIKIKKRRGKSAKIKPIIIIQVFLAKVKIIWGETNSAVNFKISCKKLEAIKFKAKENHFRVS